ncbi:MAG: adenylate cyclase, partial [Anaerolineae bacterium]|nr:adenylate cyclase [Anaerolineae bacterium]
MALTLARHFLSAKWREATLRDAALARYQDRRARRMAAWAAAHSPFYRAHWAGHDLDDWQTLPTVDKALMMAHFDQFNTRDVRLDDALAVALAAERSRDFAPLLGDLTVGLSSGTSGHRGLFLVSAEERAGWAGAIMARALHGWPRLPLRVAF